MERQKLNHYAFRSFSVLLKPSFVSFGIFISNVLKQTGCTSSRSDRNINQAVKRSGLEMSQIRSGSYPENHKGIVEFRIGN